MTVEYALSVWAAATVAVSALLLILHCEYHDGIIGRLSLCGMVLSCGIVAYSSLWLGNEFEIPRTMQLLLLSVAIFLLRLSWRFDRFRRGKKVGGQRNG